MGFISVVAGWEAGLGRGGDWAMLCSEQSLIPESLDRVVLSWGERP